MSCGERLVDLASGSRPEFLWTQPFLMLPNGKVTAAFADRRTYYYNDRVVDQQDHLGYDLASVRHASRGERKHHILGYPKPFLRGMQGTAQPGPEAIYIRSPRYSYSAQDYCTPGRPLLTQLSPASAKRPMC